MQVFGEVDLGPRLPRPAHGPGPLAAHQQMQRVLVLADALALVDDLLEQADQIAAGLRSALEEPGAPAPPPPPGAPRVARPDAPAVPHGAFHFFAGIREALVAKERLHGRRAHEP